MCILDEELPQVRIPQSYAYPSCEQERLPCLSPKLFPSFVMYHGTLVEMEMGGKIAAAPFTLLLVISLS
jgi:hypothetical protein